jgi:outer membrane protein TolC
MQRVFRYIFIVGVLTLCFLRKADGQVIDTLLVLPDSAIAFTLDDFYARILKHHPTAQQAYLLPETARQEIRMARGAFDPKVEAQMQTKVYDGKTYYDIFNGSLKFPTLFPINPSIGVDRNRGPYLNPERYIGDAFDYQQYYAGVSIPLGRGLLTDERRTALRQAHLFRELTEAEQVKIINKLLLEAAKSYWEWSYAYYNYRIHLRAVVIAEDIFRRVKMNYDFGEASVVDTVQARITWQQRQIERQEAFLTFQNTGVDLSTMLWDSLSAPAVLTSGHAPVLPPVAAMPDAQTLEGLMTQARENHPELNKLEVKILQLEADRRLASEWLKPQLNVSYYALNPINPEGRSSLDLAGSYKFGFDISMPLFLRKERAKVAMTRLKLTSTVLERDLAERQILNNLTATYNKLTNLNIVLASQREMADNYERLLEAELLNLEQGESDLFKINVQQEKFILAQAKWLKLMAEYEKQRAELYWAAGVNRLSR